MKKLLTLIFIISLTTLYTFTGATADVMTVSVDFASPTYPSGESYYGFTSTTADPLGPFSN